MSGLAAGLRSDLHPNPRSPAMKVLVKFNLVLLILFALAVAATALVSRDLLQRNAREEIRQNAKLLIESALAVRTYTSSNIAPLLETQIKYEFRPEMVSAYSAIEMLQHLRAANPDYKNFQYREATLNPTNPVNRAVDWESDIVNGFRNGTSESPLFGQRDTPNGRMLYVAKPLRAGSACLRCHDTAQAAPPTMIAKYGSANGFGWKVNEIIGAQIVQIPETFALERAETTFRTFMGALLGVLVAIAVTMNGVLWWMFIRPITRISALADRISLGEIDAPDFEARSHDEIGMLASALSRMRHSLVQAIRMLEN
jgi:HAMP domain-containing protein